MTEKDIKWGVLGTAKIARVVIAAIRKAPGGVVHAIASRSFERAQTFAKEHNIPVVYGSYDDLLDNKEIDAVYIPLPAALHEEYTIKAAQKGLHVLCEKPLTTDYHAAKRMAEACQQAGVQLMDNVMWVHHARAKKIKEYIPKLGKLSQVVSRFTTSMSDPSNVRFDPKANPSGCLGDLGWYCVKASLFAYSGELPESVYGRSYVEGGVPITFSGVLYYKDGKIATFDCGFKQTWRQFFEISGSEGLLHNDGFVLPPSANLHVYPHLSFNLATEFTVYDKATIPTVVKVEEDHQEVAVIKDFHAIIRSGKLDNFWSEETVNEQMIIDALMKSAAEKREVKL